MQMIWIIMLLSALTVCLIVVYLDSLVVLLF